MRQIQLGLLALAVVVAPATASASTWPGPAPCNTTLTACLGAVGVSVVEIATNGPVDESVSLFKSVTIRPAPGFKPAFAAARYIQIETPPGSGDFAVTIEGLTLTDGSVRLLCNDATACDFAIRRMRFLTSNPSYTASIGVSGRHIGGALTFDIAENEMDSRSDSAAEPAIEVKADGPAAVGRIRFNRVTSVGDSASPGIFANASDGTLELDVFANEVRGNFAPGAIQVGNGLLVGSSGGSAPVTLRLANNLVVGNGSSAGGIRNGVNVVADDEAITVDVANNTVTSTRGGVSFRLLVPLSFGYVTGEMRNNLIAFNGTGLDIGTGASSVENRYNLVFGNLVDHFTPGVGTVTSDPRLVSKNYPRLRAGSPAINAGDSVYVGFLLALNGLPLVDLDGLRRIIGAGPLSVDIGAYEYGDASFVAEKTVAGSNYFALDHPATNGQPSLRPQLTKNFSANNTADPYAIGAWYSGGFWHAFNQGLQTMPVGTAMNVFVPSAGTASGATYAHVASAGNTSGSETRLDNGFLNGSGGRIVLVTANWDNAVYNNHHIAVGADCLLPGPDCWFIENQDGAALPLNASFNVYAQDASPNAFVHTVGAHNRVPEGSETVLDHRLLNGIGCAQVHVTQRATVANNHPYDVEYFAPRWRIVNQDLGDIPLGAEFYVVVNARQVAECSGDLIFEDGFQ
jgi:hypothetical protein